MMTPGQMTVLLTVANHCTKHKYSAAGGRGRAEREDTENRNS